MIVKIATYLLLAFVLSGCARIGIYTQNDIDERDSQIADLQEQLQTAKNYAGELQSRLDDLQNASQDLQSNVERLQSEDWSNVVPDIESASASVDEAQDEAATAAEDLNSSLDQ
jgi:peptidoglycan hydrolase CwlO-like protein